MNETPLSKTNNVLTIFLLVAVMIVQLSTVDENEDLIITGILLIAGVFFFLDFLKTGILSFDDRHVYLKFFRRIETVPFENISKIRRNPFRFTNNVIMNYGYTIRYLDEYGVEKKAYFYVSQQNELLWERLKRQIMSLNKSVLIEE